MVDDCTLCNPAPRRRAWRVTMMLCILSVAGQAPADTLPDTVARLKASVVGVGTLERTRRPPAQLLGTGFVVGDGRHVLSNAHVVPDKLDKDKQESLVVFVGGGPAPEVRLATKVAEDLDHDLVLLKISEAPLPALQLGDSAAVREGEVYAFTGFPLGAVLGLYPVTHRGMVAAITPMAVPPANAGQLTPDLLRRLQANYAVFQLDATAYPGNSGSPLYDMATGTVMGIVNKIFVQESKENVLHKPSGISYAMPINYAKELLTKAGL